MILKEEYISQLKSNTQSYLGGYTYLNEKYKSVLISDIIEISFNSLYPTILIGLSEFGLIDGMWENDIKKVDWFLKNKQTLKIMPTGEYGKWKMFSNSLYGKIKTEYVTGYLKLFYDDMLKTYGDKIIYIDTDQIILNTKELNDDFVNKINHFEHEIVRINHFYIENLKRYILVDQFGEIRVKGFRDPKKSEIENIIKTEIRNRKFREIGI